MNARAHRRTHPDAFWSVALFSLGTVTAYVWLYDDERALFTNTSVGAIRVTTFCAACRAGLAMSSPMSFKLSSIAGRG